MKSRNFILLPLIIIISIAFQTCIDLRDSEFHPDSEDDRLPEFDLKLYTNQ